VRTRAGPTGRIPEAAVLGRDGLPSPVPVSGPGWMRGLNMAIGSRDISSALASYLERYPEEAALLAEPMRLLSQGGDLVSRRSFPVHVTAGALLVRGAEILLVEHRAYGIVLQPGGHLEPADVALAGAAERELAEETGIDLGTVFRVGETPVYIEYARVPARPDKDEPDHFHLDVGYAFTTADGGVGPIQESEVRGAGWYPLAAAEQLVGRRIGRAVCGVRPDRPARPR
jgi:8-oxo-dGTP pyrophosphatase MutT (NUDIX family)